MKLYNQAQDLVRGSETFRMFDWALAVLSLISACFAVSVVVFIRKDFGERYLGWMNLFFGYTVVANFTFLGGMIAAMTGRGGQGFMTLFWAAFILMSLFRRWQITRRNNAGIEWHSMYIGTSILPLPCSDEKIYKFFEPAIVFAVGYMFWGLSGQVGLWLMIGGVSLLVNNHIVFYNERRSLLDLRDAQIEAKYLGAAVSGKPVKETAGFIVAESSAKLMRQEASLTGAFANLSPGLKEVLDQKSEAGSQKPVSATAHEER